MDSGRSVAGTAALLEFLATATRTRIVAADLWSSTNDRHKLLLPTKAILVLHDPFETGINSARPGR
jgi:hypothetical protein